MGMKFHIFLTSAPVEYSHCFTSREKDPETLNSRLNVLYSQSGCGGKTEKSLSLLETAALSSPPSHSLY
jgi:hypothetical protein